MRQLPSLCLLWAHYWNIPVSCDIISDVGAYVIDLTHTFDTDTPYWADKDSFKFTRIQRGPDKNGWYEGNAFAAAEHGGTHINAPAHFSQGKSRIHNVPLERLMGHAVRMDFTRKAALNPDYEITADDLKGWEREYGPLANRTIVLLDTGWTHKWPNKTLIFGSDNPTSPATYHFPGLHPEAAQWLVDERPGVMAVGIDSPSIDHGQTTTFTTHRILSSRNVSAFENVANLHLVPPRNATIFAAPMKIGDGSGGPLRVFVLVPTKSIPTECTGDVYSRRLVELSLVGCLLCIIYTYLMR